MAAKERVIVRSNRPMQPGEEFHYHTKYTRMLGSTPTHAVVTRSVPVRDPHHPWEIYGIDIENYRDLRDVWAHDWDTVR